jgi:hypothetical protein
MVMYLRIHVSGMYCTHRSMYRMYASTYLRIYLVRKVITCNFMHVSSVRCAYYTHVQYVRMYVCTYVTYVGMKPYLTYVPCNFVMIVWFTHARTHLVLRVPNVCMYESACTCMCTHLACNAVYICITHVRMYVSTSTHVYVRTSVSRGMYRIKLIHVWWYMQRVA